MVSVEVPNYGKRVSVNHQHSLSPQTEPGVGFNDLRRTGGPSSQPRSTQTDVPSVTAPPPNPGRLDPAIPASIRDRARAQIAAANGHLKADGHDLAVISEANPEKLPWRDLGVDIVMECTGRFTDRDAAAKHLAAGAKRVLDSFIEVVA